MSEEYISRKAVRDAIASLSIERFELTPAYRLYVEALDNVDKKVVKIPAADVEPVRHGKWTIHDVYEYKLADRTTAYEPVFACSACGMHTESYVRGDYPQMPDDADFPKYCPNCGARMDGEE